MYSEQMKIIYGHYQILSHDYANENAFLCEWITKGDCVDAETYECYKYFLLYVYI